MLALIGFAYGVDELYDIARLTGISLANSLVVLALACAAQAGRPDAGLPALMCREDEVGVFARRLLPADRAAALRHRLVAGADAERGVVDRPFAVSAMALVLIVVLLVIIWRTGTQLDRVARRRARHRTRAQRERAHGA